MLLTCLPFIQNLLLQSQARKFKNVLQKQENVRTYVNRRRRGTRIPQFQPGDLERVRYSHGSGPKYSRPFKIHSTRSRYNYQLENGKRWNDYRLVKYPAHPRPFENISEGSNSNDYASLDDGLPPFLPFLNGTSFHPVSQPSPASSPAEESVELPSDFSSQPDTPEESLDSSAQTLRSQPNSDSSTPPAQPEFVLRRSTRTKQPLAWLKDYVPKQ